MHGLCEIGIGQHLILLLARWHDYDSVDLIKPLSTHIQAIFRPVQAPSPMPPLPATTKAAKRVRVLNLMLTRHDKWATQCLLTN